MNIAAMIISVISLHAVLVIGKETALKATMDGLEGKNNFHERNHQQRRRYVQATTSVPATITIAPTLETITNAPIIFTTTPTTITNAPTTTTATYTTTTITTTTTTTNENEENYDDDCKIINGESCCNVFLVNDWWCAPGRNSKLREGVPFF